jgi:hypothetical protein
LPRPGPGQPRRQRQRHRPHDPHASSSSFLSRIGTAPSLSSVSAHTGDPVLDALLKGDISQFLPAKDVPRTARPESRQPSTRSTPAGHPAQGHNPPPPPNHPPRSTGPAEGPARTARSRSAGPGLRSRRPMGSASSTASLASDRPRRAPGRFASTGRLLPSQTAGTPGRGPIRTARSNVPNSESVSARDHDSLAQVTVTDNGLSSSISDGGSFDEFDDYTFATSARPAPPHSVSAPNLPPPAVHAFAQRLGQSGPFVHTWTSGVPPDQVIDEEFDVIPPPRFPGAEKAGSATDVTELPSHSAAIAHFATGCPAPPTPPSIAALRAGNVALTAQLRALHARMDALRRGAAVRRSMEAAASPAHPVRASAGIGGVLSDSHPGNDDDANYYHPPSSKPGPSSLSSANFTAESSAGHFGRSLLMSAVGADEPTPEAPPTQPGPTRVSARSYFAALASS